MPSVVHQHISAIGLPCYGKMCKTALSRVNPRIRRVKFTRRGRKKYRTLWTERMPFGPELTWSTDTKASNSAR